MKRGQVTILLVVAVVIIAAVIFILFLNTSSKQTAIDVSKIDPVILPVYNHYLSCIETLTDEAVEIIGLSGGYIKLPEEYLNAGSSKIGYGISKGKKVLVTNDKIEDEIEDYLERFSTFCIDSDDFLDLIIEDSKSEFKIKIEEGKIIVEVIKGFSIIKEEKGYEFKEGGIIEIKSEMYGLIKTSENIIDSQIKDLDSIDLISLSEQDHPVEVVPFDEENFIFFVKSSENNEKQEIFRFGVNK